MTIIIYLDSTKQNKRVIRPTQAFQGDPIALVNDLEPNRYHYQIIK